ncbi:MAG: hypothetical protein LIO96_07905 [Lachnospiraceae bacterium]|nr:hypothetical protein [Lachnospiraceae bacterium]
MKELYIVIPDWMTMAQAEVFMNELRFTLGYGEVVYCGFDSSIATWKYWIKSVYLGDGKWSDKSWIDHFYLLPFNTNFPGVHVRTCINSQGDYLIDYILRNERTE